MKADGNKIETVDIDDSELVGIHDGEYVPEGKQIMSLSFSDSGKPIIENTTAPDIAAENTPNINNTTIQNQKMLQNNQSHEEMTFTQKLRGLTPKRDNEAFTIKRCYQFRPSTLKKLNVLKVNSNDINAYLNEIIDDAICYYYDVVFGNE